MRRAFVLGAAFAVICCNAIVGNEDVQLVQDSGANGGSGNLAGATSGGAAGSSATGGAAGSEPDASDGSSVNDAADVQEAAAPKAVKCGNTACDPQSGYCCVTTTEKKCWAPSVACQGLDIACDGPEDCVGDGSVGICCATLVEGGTKPDSVKCQTSCSASQRVICGSVPTACPSGKTCQTSPDYPDYKICL